MKQPVIIYATFAPSDSVKAHAELDQLHRIRPEVILIGRQQFGFSAEDGQVTHAIERASITLILIGRNTFTSEAVRSDLQASLDKQPPNQLLAIYLDNEEELLGTEQAADIAGISNTGAEILPFGTDLSAGLDRAVLRLRRAEQIKRISDAAPSGTCGR